ncbi:twin-arginine translocation pathway signal protein, partial [Escherichia coli]
MRRLGERRNTLEAYDAALASGDTETVKSLVGDMLADGVDPVSVLTDVVAAAQREVGRRWKRGEFTVAQEHAATATAISATKVVAQHVQRMPVT